MKALENPKKLALNPALLNCAQRHPQQDAKAVLKGPARPSPKLLGARMCKKPLVAYAPRVGPLNQKEEVCISGPSPVSRLKSGHSDISGVLYSDDSSFEIASRSVLFDDRAEIID